MKYSSSALAYAALAAQGASAFPQLGSAELDNFKRQAADDHHWQPAGAGDVRAPCPGMNTLANHGYISRNGRGIRNTDIQQGFLQAFGFDPSITTPGSNNAISLCSSQTGRQCETFDLDMMNQPHQIEHDGSMTRLDREMANNMNADNHDFNMGIFQQTLDIIGDQDHINATTANTVRLRRYEEAQQQDAPGWFVRNDGGALAEHGFTITCMNDRSRDNPAANLDFVKYWWQNERLPTAIGWNRPQPTIDQAYFNNVVNSVSAAKTYAATSTSSSASASSSSSSQSTSASTGTSASSGTSATSTASSASSAGSSAASSGASSGSSGSSMPSSTGSSSKSVPTPSMSTTSSGAGAGGYPTSSPESALASATASENPTIVSSAASKASANTNQGGPRPALNGYQQEHPASEWKSVADQCHQAVIKVQVEVIKLLRGGYAGAKVAMGGSSGSGSSGSGSSGSGSSGSGSSGSGSSGSGSYNQAPPPGNGGGNGGKKTKTIVVTQTTTVSDCTCPSSGPSRY